MKGRPSTRGLPFICLVIFHDTPGGIHKGVFLLIPVKPVCLDCDVCSVAGSFQEIIIVLDLLLIIM
jgi:hypothetical protein